MASRRDRGSQSRRSQGSAFSSYAKRYFQNNVPLYYEANSSIRQSILKLDNRIDRKAALGIWKTIYAFMHTTQSNFRYQGLPKLVLTEAIKEIQDIIRNETQVETQLLSTGTIIDSSNLEKVHFIIAVGIVRETLRDEIICQIVKQCISNPSEVSVSRGWILLALTIGCFAPSEQLVRCLVSFFRDEKTEHSKFCEQLLTRTIKNGPRKQPPSYMELKAANTLHMIALPVSFMDGTVKEIEVDAQVTGSEMRSIIASKIGLQDQFGFSIFCAVDNEVNTISAGTDHVMDYVSQCEQYRKKSGHSERSPDWKIYFAKGLFAPWHDPAEDKVSTDLIYYQVIRGIKHGEYKCETTQELADIVANEYYITHGNNLDRELLLSLLPSYLPEEALEDDGALNRWADHVQQSFTQINEYKDNKNEYKMKENIVTSARIKWPFVFSRSFNVDQVSGPPLLSSSRSVILTITWKGVHFYDNHENLLLYLRYRDIVEIGLSGRKEEVLTLSTTKKGTYSFQSEHSSAIHNILFYIWDGLKRRSTYCIAMYDNPPAEPSQLSFQRGDIIIMDENCNGESLISSGRASGKNDRTKKWGNFSASFVYIVPVVPIQTSSASKQAPNKSSPISLRTIHVEEPVAELNEEKKKRAEFVLRSQKETSPKTLERKEMDVVDAKTEREEQQTSVKIKQIKELEDSIKEKNDKISYLKGQRNNDNEEHRKELERRLSEISSTKVIEIQRPLEDVTLKNAAITQSPQSRIVTLETYARDYFTDNMTWVHQKEAISQPLHKALLRSQEKKEMAIQIFRLILMYMGESSGKSQMSKIQLTDEIFAPALDEELIRDELYCQLIKQLTFNSSWESEKKCWELMWLCTGLFSPASLELKQQLRLFLKSSGKPLSNACLSRLERVIILGSRKAPPHYMETESVHHENSALAHKFLLPDETEALVEVDSLSKPPTILRDVAQKLNLKTSEGLGIFVRVNQQVLGMADTEYLFDFLWLLVSLGKPDSHSGIDYELYVTKKVWSKTVGGEDVIADRIFHYNQELPRYILGYHKCSLRDAIELSGLVYRVYHGENSRPSDSFPDLLDEIVPRTIRKSKSNSQWVQSIMAEHRKNPGMTKDEAKVEFIKKMQTWPSFGSVFFETQQDISQDFPQNVYVAINKRGINVIHHETKEILKNYSYDVISHWRSGDETFEVKIVENHDEKRIVFRTHLDYEMDDLLTSYVAFNSNEEEAETLNILWSRTVREILRSQVPQANDYR